jgi:hypothetical protein
VGREIERYKREREEEMRKQQMGMARALSTILHHWWLGGGAILYCKQTDSPPRVNI